MPIIESALIVKGAMAIGHWLSAHGTSAMAAKGGAVLAKSAAVNGVASTATATATAATGASLVVGYYVWTTESIGILGEGLDAVYEGDAEKFVEKISKLVMKMNMDLDELPEQVQNFLVKADFSYEQAHQLAGVVQAFDEEIEKSVRRKRGY